MPFLKQSLVNPDNHEFDYTLNTVPNTSAEVNTLDEDDPEFNHTFNSFQKKSRKKKPLVDSVSEAVGALNLTATSLPRGFHESAHGRTGSGLADTFARFESPYDRSGDAILPNPAQQSSYKKLKATTKIGDNSFDSFKDYLKGDGKKRCTSRGFPAPHEVVKNYGAPGVRHHGKSPSPHAVENYEAWKKETFEEYIRATRARPASPAGPVGPWKNETSEDFNPKATHAKASRPQTIEGWQNETSEDFNPEATRPEASRPQKIEGWQHETSEDFNPKATRPEASRPQKIEGWETQTPKDFKRKAPRAEASFSSEGSKSPAYHAERRERETEQERRDQPGKSHGRKSRDGQPPTLQQSPYLPGPPPGHGSNAQAHETAKGKESKGKKSGDGGKHKDGKSKDDTQGGGHRRGDGSRRADRG